MSRLQEKMTTVNDDVARLAGCGFMMMGGRPMATVWNGVMMLAAVMTADGVEGWW